MIPCQSKALLQNGQISRGDRLAAVKSTDCVSDSRSFLGVLRIGDCPPCIAASTLADAPVVVRKADSRLDVTRDISGALDATAADLFTFV